MRLVFVAIAVALVLVTSASAVPPMLSNVTADRRHPRATITAPRAESVFVYIASRPDRATDGSFFTENVEATDFLTDDELQRGSWLYERQLDPGTWYLLANASAETSCYSEPPPEHRLVRDPACAHGYSDVVPLTISKPTSRYSAKVEVLRYIGIVYLTLRATSLGENRAYRVCWRSKVGRRICVRGTLNGYDWAEPATDFLRVSTRGMSRFTTFAWYVGAKAVARKRIRVR